MPSLTFEVETGASSATSNSYASVAEADAFMGSHLSGSTWANQSQQRKETILISAARLIDAEVVFRGYKTQFGQAMQFPRAYLEIQTPTGYYQQPYMSPDGETLNSALLVYGSYLPTNYIPPQLKTAQLELAVLLLTGGDRGADADSDGIASVSLGKGAVAVTFDKTTAKTLLGRLAPALLSEFAESTGGNRGGMVKLVRM